MANITNITMNVAAGEIYKIEIPVVPKMGLGYEPKSGSVLDISGNEQILQNGFYVETKSVGEIIEVVQDAVAIKYKHKLPSNNLLWFFAETGEVVKFSIELMPVHDHASILTGGPAFGTYYSTLPEDGE